MTLRQLLNDIAPYTPYVYSYFAALPILALLSAWLIPSAKRSVSPARYLYSVWVYLACLPGMLALVLVGYTLFFIRGNLLDAPIGLYFLPIVSMILTLVFIGKAVNFEDLPGFERISGLMVLCGLTFGILLFIQKLHIGILFWGGFTQLIILGVFIFLVLKWASYRLFRSPKEPRRSWSSFVK